MQEAMEKLWLVANKLAQAEINGDYNSKDSQACIRNPLSSESIEWKGLIDRELVCRMLLLGNVSHV